MANKREAPVRLTRIYTGGGDKGETSLGDGSRVAKDNDRVEAVGDVDELNAAIGLVLCTNCPGEISSSLQRIQNDLFDLGADISVPVPDESKAERLRISSEQVSRLESECDSFNAKLEDLTSFVLPGGTETAARLHHARTVARRAERRVVRLQKTADVNQAALIYINRLSDLLFILARFSCHIEGAAETLWKPGASQ